jgi:outer membrane protein assembly factor BamB
MLAPLSFSFSSSAATSPIRLTSTHAQTYGLFGLLSATTGKLALVGAGFEGTGHAYLYNTVSGALLRTFSSPHPVNLGLFGVDVAGPVKGGLIALGAPNERAGGFTWAGRAYVYNASTGALIHQLVSPNAQKDGHFGQSVALSDGFVAVGAWNETSNGNSQAGQVYVFNATTGTLLWSIRNPSPQNAIGFGWSSSASGNLLAVAASGEDNQEGSAFVFNMSSHALVASIGPFGGDFGYSLAMSGTRLVVGEPYANDIAGAALLFNALNGRLILTLVSPNHHPPQYAYGEFGKNVAINGNHIMIGAYQESGIASEEEGQAYLFSTSGALLRSFATTTPSPEGGFGRAVAISGNTVIIAAPYEYVKGMWAAGHVYLYHL